MKKLFTKLSAIFSLAVAFAFSAFAEGEVVQGIDVSGATAALSDMQSAASTWWTAAQPVVLAVIGIALVATLIWGGYKLIRKGVNKIG